MLHIGVQCRLVHFYVVVVDRRAGKARVAGSRVSGLFNSDLDPRDECRSPIGVAAMSTTMLDRKSDSGVCCRLLRREHARLSMMPKRSQSP